MEQKTSKSNMLEKRREKIKELKDKNINLFPNGYTVSHSVEDIRKIIEESPESPDFSDKVFTLAGRMMAINIFGKSSFIRFKDRTGKLQAYIAKDKVGDDAYSIFKQMDTGDFVWLKGNMFKTRTGEWTLLADEIKLLAKSYRPLPEKFHGLKDPEKRYRKRYLDLIMNHDTKDIFIKRSLIIQNIRNFLLKRDFLEVETPMMQPIAGGAEAEPFITHHNALNMQFYLRIAPELYLKRLVVGGFERVFEINRNFRNEGISTQHNPEFTMLEFYQAHATYKDLMILTEDMFKEVVTAITGTTSITYQGTIIDFSKKWEKIPIIESLQKIGGVDSSILDDKKKLLNFASQKDIKITKTNSLGKIIAKIFDVLVEPKLIQPTFITDYPVEISPLSRRNDEHPDFTERFELFIAGREIANGFSELNDPEDQKLRFLNQMEARKAGDKEAHMMDEDYIEALEYGLPPTAGEGIGIDRLAMLLTDSASIREVILFPHMKNQR
jgi:lysyl-tRNA synthetase, class II